MIYILKSNNLFLRILLYIIFILDLSLLFFGLYKKNTDIELGEKLIGSSVLAFCFIFLPIFLYYRYSKRNLEDYIYKD